jgi:hypothetical protein
MGSFCNLAGALIDLGYGHVDGDRILVAGGGATGEALGLESAQIAQGAVKRALVMSFIPLQASEGLRELWVEEGFGAAFLEEGVFDEAAAAQAPGGVKGDFELVHLEAFGGGELMEQGVVHGGEVRFLAGHYEVLRGTEAVTDSVARGSGFTGFGAGAGRVLCVGRIGSRAGFGCHDLSLERRSGTG